MKKTKARRSTITVPRIWLIRAGIGIAAGLIIGFTAGAIIVRVMQPPAVADADSDSAFTPRPVVNGDAISDAATSADSVRPANGIVVPQLIGLEEGEARSAITRAGFTVGTVTFKAGVEPMGTVVAAFPVPGEAVVLPATVNLILSDGKPRPDSAPPPPPPFPIHESESPALLDAS